MDRLLDWIDERPGRRFLAHLAPGSAAFIAGWSVLEPLGVAPGLHTVLSLVLFSLLVVVSSHGLVIRRRFRRLETSIRRDSLETGAHHQTCRHTVGVVAPLSTWTTDFYRDLVAGIRVAAERESPTLQRRIIVFDVPKESYDSVADLAAFAALEHTVDGVISVNIRLPDDLVQRLSAAGTPVLNAFHEENGPPFIGNIVPNHAGFGNLLKSLLEDQSARPAILVTKPLANPYKKISVDPFRNDKREVFLEASRLAGLRQLKPKRLDNCESLRQEEPNFAVIIEIEEYTISVGRQLFQACLEFLPPNTAVVCLADVVAAGIILAAKRSGRSCEERHLRVTGFDNSPLAEELELTSVDYRLDLVGRLAYDKIQAAIEHGVTLNTTTDRVDTRYIERRSSRW